MTGNTSQDKVSFSTEVLEDHVNVTAIGEIDSTSSIKFEHELRKLITKGHTKIAVNAEHISLITSAGLRVLLMMAKELYRVSGGFVLYGCQPGVVEVFRITGFDSILHLVDSYEDALTELGGTLTPLSDTKDDSQRVFH